MLRKTLTSPFLARRVCVGLAVSSSLAGPARSWRRSSCPEAANAWRSPSDATVEGVWWPSTPPLLRRRLLCLVSRELQSSSGQTSFSQDSSALQCSSALQDSPASSSGDAPPFKSWSNMAPAFSSLASMLCCSDAVVVGLRSPETVTTSLSFNTTGGLLSNRFAMSRGTGEGVMMPSAPSGSAWVFTGVHGGTSSVNAWLGGVCACVAGAPGAYQAAGQAEGARGGIS
mmetsp:Transcript_53891/g.125735  ORF Transcript_53891/g.125735 Transcript_53891/m.125735 type:complete len:228 (-) Transcript_53891:517-1200(-)